jgi:hypothetical protein
MMGIVCGAIAQSICSSPDQSAADIPPATINRKNPVKSHRFFSHNVFLIQGMTSNNLGMCRMQTTEAILGSKRK